MVGTQWSLRPPPFSTSLPCDSTLNIVTQAFSSRLPYQLGVLLNYSLHVPVNDFFTPIVLAKLYKTTLEMQMGLLHTLLPLQSRRHLSYSPQGGKPSPTVNPKNI